MTRLVDLVRPFALGIKNGRTKHDALRHLKSEVFELEDELEGTGDGADGVVGEAVDVIACALDIIVLERPDITDEEVAHILKLKCEKWMRRYADSVDGDRSID
jgi:hypothetical protein